MVETEQLLELMEPGAEQVWSERLFALSRDIGFERTLIGIIQSKEQPLEDAFLCSNYPEKWREAYDSQRFHHIDPTVAHCLSTTVPLVWTPEMFRTDEQKILYEQACGHGIRAGISFPLHGPNGEFGIASFVSDRCAGKKSLHDILHFVADLALIRDYAFESGLRFASRRVDRNWEELGITPRETECLKWAMIGKSSWETARILRCSESTINFHIANIRRKLEVNTRRQAVVKAIRLGLIAPG